MQPKISVFQTVNPSSFKGHFLVADVLKTIRSEKFKASTYQLRKLTDAEAAKVYKAGKQDEQGRLVEPGHFYGVTWSGLFEGGKKASNLQAHSGLMCMDIDGLTIADASSLFRQLRTDEFTHILFISPSGNGLKWIAKIDLKNVEEHKLYFRQLSDYLYEGYGLTRKGDVAKGEKPQIDPSGCNVDRLCFLPYDPDAYHNPDSPAIPLLEEYQPSLEPLKVPQTSVPLIDYGLPVEDTQQRLGTCINELMRANVDLTINRDDWIKIGFAFASLGEEGRVFYHSVSRLHPKYNHNETDTKFNELLRNRNGRVNIGTFFHLCETALGNPASSYQRERSVAIYDRVQSNQPLADLSIQDPQEWPKPQPFESNLLPVMSITADMIPEPLRPWLSDIAYRMKCPLDFVAAEAVVMLSSLIGTRLTIKPKTRDDWTVVPNLWGAVIGGPSSMKTPSINQVLKPLNRLIALARKEFEEAMNDYERASVEYEAQKKAYASQAQERLKGKAITISVDYPEAPAKPKEQRYVVNDSTVEKLADLLNENPTGLLVLRDELTGLLATWERSGHEQDRAFHLEAWNGDGSITTDRMGRGTTHVRFLCESLLGGIQPSKLLPYLKAATSYENDGFVQRLQVAVYPDPTPWEYKDEYPDQVARDRAFNLIQAIVSGDFKAIGYDTDDHNKFPYTRFDTHAQEIFKQWLTKLETEIIPNETGLLQEHFTKYRSLMPSLSVIFHIVNCVDAGKSSSTSTEKLLVSADTTQMAVRWSDYLMSHARRIYGLLDSSSIESAKELLRHLKAGDLKDQFNAREVRQKGWSNLTTSDAVESALDELVTRNWLREEIPPATGNGRPLSAKYSIHPKILLNNL